MNSRRFNGSNCIRSPPRAGLQNIGSARISQEVSEGYATAEGLACPHHRAWFAADYKVVAEIDHLGVFANHASCSVPPGMITTSPWPQTRCSLPRRNSILSFIG